jgi:hypothetical protein
MIAQQFGITIKGVVDVTNTLVKKAQVVIKNICQDPRLGLVTKARSCKGVGRE